MKEIKIKNDSKYSTHPVEVYVYGEGGVFEKRKGFICSGFISELTGGRVIKSSAGVGCLGWKRVLCRLWRVRFQKRVWGKGLNRDRE